jgi:hypothetical protein
MSASRWQVVYWMKNLCESQVGAIAILTCCYVMSFAIKSYATSLRQLKDFAIAYVFYDYNLVKNPVVNMQIPCSVINLLLLHACLPRKPNRLSFYLDYKLFAPILFFWKA